MGEVDAIREGQSAMSAAKDKEVSGDMGLEMEEDDGCAPRKYYEYLHSLNDRQREAACSDVAVPLMIVAGPGSGKVHFFLNFDKLHIVSWVLDIVS